jgi:hypothetical protein
MSATNPVADERRLGRLPSFEILFGMTLKDVLGFSAFLALVWCVFIGVKQGLLHTNQIPKLLNHYWLVLGIGVAGVGLSMREAPESYRVVLRSCLLLFTGYLAVGYYSLPIDNAALGLFVGPLRWLAVACGLVACFRPSFGLLLFLYMLWFKKVAVAQSGLNISLTDYTAVAEIGLFLVLGLLCHGAVTRILKRFSKSKFVSDLSKSSSISEPASVMSSAASNQVDIAAMPATCGGLGWLLLFLYVTVLIHFSNYFYSGVQKVLLNHSLTTWIFENRTEYLILNAKQYGILPISQLLDAFPPLYSLIAAGTPVINSLSLFSQLLVVFAIFRIRWMVVLTLIFDLFHVAIFVLSGIFFWKWVILNLSIVVALRKFPKASVPLPVIIIGLLCMLVAPSIFFIARLGWFDTRSPVISYVEAITKDKKHIRVPSNYFLQLSVTLAQSRVGRPLEGHFPTGGLGITSDYATMQQANRCALKPAGPHRVSEKGFQSFAKYIRRHHRFVLKQLDNHGRFHYDLYPHHIWSNPIDSAAFHALDKREIQGYRLVVESACLDYQNGQFTKDIQARSTRDISL